jgi:hypothetical protein
VAPGVPAVSQVISWVLGEGGAAGVTMAALMPAVAQRLECELTDDLAAEILHQSLNMVTEGVAAAGFWRRPVATEVTERPVAPRFSRWQAMQGRDSVTSLLHAEVAADPLDRVLLRDLDGELDFVGIMALVTRALAEGRLQIDIDDEPLEDPEQLGELVQLKLQRFLRHGLLTDETLLEREMAPLVTSRT